MVAHFVEVLIELQGSRRQVSLKLEVKQIQSEFHRFDATIVLALCADDGDS